MLDTLPTFSPQTETLLARADHLCAHRRTKLTDTRRLILGLILEQPKPIGAYDLLEHLRDTHRAAAPPTVYRALDFLLEQGLIHKIERLSAFIGCGHALDCHHGEDCVHRAQFLICRLCGTAQEMEDSTIGTALAQAARRHGFTPEHATIEVEGLCATCQAQTTTA